MKYPFYVIGIGFSAGGLTPIKEIVEALPTIDHAAYILIPHLLANGDSRLDKILSKHTSIPVRWAIDEMMLSPNHIYLLPQNKMMTVHNGVFYVRDRYVTEIVNKAIDLLLGSIAKDAGSKAIGVILSGGGQDGLAGAREIHEHRGTVIVQDPTSAEFPFMPENIVLQDNPQQVLTPQEIAELLSSSLADPSATQKLLRR